MKALEAADVARAFYAALAAGDRDQLDALLHPEFSGRTAEGMPFEIGGQHDGPAAMRRNVWGTIARHFEARAEPDRFLDLSSSLK
jgi:2-(1,2-epoxy-1,2-dihydrophenyl)acetyl-CoA isomerase